MTHRLFDFSSDVGVEAEGSSLPDALGELGCGLARVLTDGGRVKRSEEHPVDVAAEKDPAGAAVTFLNELIYLFDTDQFLVADAKLRVEATKDGTRIVGTVLGERFDEARHGAGRGVKAATYHDASYRVEGGRHKLRVVLDL